MSLFWGIVAYVLYVYLLVILARLVLETTRQFARAWRPSGIAAVGFELVYVATDPPIRALRRLIPPLQLGGARIDLSVMLLLLAVVALQWGALALSR